MLKYFASLLNYNTFPSIPFHFYRRQMPRSIMGAQGFNPIDKSLSMVGVSFVLVSRKKTACELEGGVYYVISKGLMFY